MMKIKPFEEFIGEDSVVTYIGIRADENREGYISKKESVKPVFPFIEDGLIRDDIFRILEQSVGIPEYYKWRSRSGCYFCFFQQQKEWLGLKRNHPELYKKAKQLEERKRKKVDWSQGASVEIKGHGYTWSSQGPLDELIAKAEAREKNNQHNDSSKKKVPERWQDALKDDDDDDPEDQACTICSL